MRALACETWYNPVVAEWYGVPMIDLEEDELMGDLANA